MDEDKKNAAFNGNEEDTDNFPDLGSDPDFNEFDPFVNEDDLNGEIPDAEFSEIESEPVAQSASNPEKKRKESAKHAEETDNPLEATMNDAENADIGKVKAEPFRESACFRIRRGFREY